MTLPLLAAASMFMVFPQEDQSYDGASDEHGELSRFNTLMRVERGDLRVDDAAVFWV